MAVNKWMQAAANRMEKRGTVGALHESMDVPAGKKIPTSAIRAEAAELKEKAEGDKKLTKSDLTKLRRINFALRARGS